jgi:hypothetical protein
MCQHCAVCDLKFQREEGYFLGAMYISFGLALAIIALIAALLWAITGWWINNDVIWALILFLPLAPSISLFARVLWIYLDQTFDPEPPPPAAEGQMSSSARSSAARLVLAWREK